MTILAWQRGGDGPSVVAVHTWASDGTADWDRTGIAAALTKAGLSVLAPDLPGHAESADVLVPPDAEPARWTAHACLADLDRIGVDTVAVMAYADGGPVAGHLVASAPDRVDRLVLIGCDDVVEVPHAAEIAAALSDPGATVWHPEAAEIVARARIDRRHHLPTLAQWIERRRWPAAPRLGALRLPVLLAVGARDPHRARAPRLGQLFHDARLVTVPGDQRGALSSPQLARQVTDFLVAVSQPR
ncbi:MAG: alpha/beta fold hydrolase [Egibacteraceae bacterium]